VNVDLAVASDRIRTLNGELDGIPYSLRGIRKWLDRVSERSRLLLERAQLLDERRAMIDLN
jgi:hypothetical protein